MRLYWLLSPLLCSALYPCDVSNKSTCGDRFCNFALFTRPVCDFTWTNAPGASYVPFMCVTSNLTGSCERCPPGWTSYGAFCKECDEVNSCDRNGVVSCRGACSVGTYPVCDTFVNRVACNQCAFNATSLLQAHKRVTRGGVLGAPDICDAYFECDVGYYLNQNTNGELNCMQCVVPEASVASWVFASRGLTFGDAYSCVYKPVANAVSLNSWGQFGTPLQSCPLGMTSQPGFASSMSDCARCPSQPLNGGFDSTASDCIPVCNRGYTRVGEACVLSDATTWDCRGDGYDYISGAQFHVNPCTPQPYPWNSPGFSALAPRAFNVVTVKRAIALVTRDEMGSFYVIQGQNKISTPNVSDFCSHLVATFPNTAYVQDRPLSTFICSDTEKHEFYLLVSGPKYLYAFLERSFGNNNRFVLWQVQKQRVSAGNNAGQIWQRWRLPAKVCSAVVVPGDVVYIAFCGAPFISYVIANDYMGSTDIRYDVWSQGVGYWLGRQTKFLIGQDTPGQRDGMRDQALFKSRLSIAVPSDDKRLFVADQGNCRVVEIVIDFPGSYLTRATTIGHGFCFSGGFPLPYPRLITAVSGAKAFLMVTDRGLVQLDASTRVYMSVMGTQELDAVISNLQWMSVADQGQVIVLSNATHDVSVTLQSEPCPVGHVSKRGGSCVSCPEATFASQNLCTACTQLTCQANYSLVPCTPSEDAKCVPCSGSPSYPFRYGPDCGFIPLYPCPPGFWGLSDCLPCASSLLGSLPSHGVCQCLGVPLTGTAPDLQCVVPSPFPVIGIETTTVPDWTKSMACTYLDANCSDRMCYLARVHPRQCLPCPVGFVGVNGFWCELCPGFRDASNTGDFCVCREPSVLSSDGRTCECPPGFSAGGPAGCAVCQIGKYRDTAGVLSDDYASNASMGVCGNCPPGTQPTNTRSSCESCEVGYYKESNMVACQRCPGAASFALDPRYLSSCTACVSSCELKYSWNQCPVNASLFVCEPCPALNRFKRWVARSENYKCEWECVAGFYEFNGECWPCTRKNCDHGYKETLCTKYEDSHCRVPCASETKPSEHSIWLNDCNWECEPGFTKILVEYPAWADYVCVVADEFTSGVF